MIMGRVQGLCVLGGVQEMTRAEMLSAIRRVGGFGVSLGAMQAIQHRSGPVLPSRYPRSPD